MTTLLNLDPSQVPEDGNGLVYNAASKKWLPGAAPDAASSVKGVVALAGDLGGTADAPTVPGLAAIPPQAPIAAPVTFSSLPQPQIHRLGSGQFLPVIDLDALRPPAGVTYYVHPDGANVADGLTSSTPTNLLTALAKADVGTIVLAPGEYYRNLHTVSQTSKSINWLASGPGVKVTGYNSPASTTWTNTAGSIYQTSRSATAQVVDVINRTSWGDATVYEKVTDLASITQAGQWAIVGSTVYVWPIGDTDLTAIANRYQIRLGLSTTYTGINISGGTTYAHGIDFEGQAYGIAASAGTLILDSCTVRYSLVDGVISSGGNIIARNVTASSNATDGFSYTGDGVEFLEIDCYAHHNGNTPGAATNNASTAHNTAKGIRVGGTYDHAGGPVVADVNSAKTWNLGCYSGASNALDPQNHSWRIDALGYESDPATMWLDQCRSAEARYAFKTTGPGVIHLHRHTLDNLNATDPSSAGTIDYYTP